MSCTVYGTKHKCSTRHSDLVAGYHAERERQEWELESITYGYAGDLREYFARGGKPLITFKQWLVQNAGS